MERIFIQCGVVIELFVHALPIKAELPYVVLDGHFVIQWQIFEMVVEQVSFFVTHFE